MISTSVKDILIQKTAQDLKQPEDVVEKVVAFQFRDAARATHHAGEIEISGFGKFVISQPKVKRKIARLEEIEPRMQNKLQSMQGEEHTRYEQRIESLKQELSFLYGKLK